MFNPFATKTENPQHAGQALAAKINEEIKVFLDVLNDIQPSIKRIQENLQEEGGYLLRQITQRYPGLITKEAFNSATTITSFVPDEEDVAYRGMRR